MKLLDTKDFPGDYITKELAAKIANEKFADWITQRGICLHPLNKIKAVFLSYPLIEQDLECECGEKVEVVKVDTRSTPYVYNKERRGNL